MLRVIDKNPNLPSSKFARLLGMSMKKAIELRRRAVEVGWVTEHRMDSGTRGGQAIVLVLTEKGRKVLEDMA